MKFSKLFCSLLSVGLLASVVSIPVHAEESLEPGVTVTTPTQEDLGGEYGEAYKTAGYKATFVYKTDSGQKVYVGGTMQFFNTKDVSVSLTAEDAIKNAADRTNIPLKDGNNVSTLSPHAKVYTAYEYTEGCFPTGFNVVGAEVGRGNYVNYTDGGKLTEEGVKVDTSEVIPNEEYKIDSNVITAADGSVLYEMTEVENGVYTVSLPLPSTEYLYKYYIPNGKGDYNSVFDPVNYPIVNEGDNADPGWSYFFVGDSEHAVAGQEYIFPRTDGKTGTWEFTSYKGKSGAEQWVSVYLPYGYDKSQTYKTIYLSHGGGGDETEWFQVGAAANIMDNLIAEGLTDPAIVVCMNNSTIWSESKGEGASWTAPTDYEYVWDNMKNYLVPAIEDKYSVSKNAEDRAMAGLSVGGRTASNYYVQEPGFFSYYASFSGFEFQTPVEEWDVEAMNNVFIYTSAGNVDFGLGYYGQDPKTDQRMGGTAAEFLALLELAGVNEENYHFDLFNGAHDWYVWRASFTTFVKDYLWANNVAKDPAVEVNPNDDVNNTPSETTTPNNPETTVDPEATVNPTTTVDSTTKTVDPVDTGDSTNVVIPLTLLTVSVVAFVAIKKKKLLK